MFFWPYCPVQILLINKWGKNIIFLILSHPPQLPHGLPPTSLGLEREVEKQFLQDPAWLPIHDTDFAFQKFLKYTTLFIILMSLLKAHYGHIRMIISPIKDVQSLS